MKRIGNSFKGILGGLIAIVLGAVLLWWNEGNNVRNLKTTAEMSKSVIDVSSEKVDAANEGKLIATHGALINEKELQDETFNVKVKTPVLRRVVEVYQWEEDSSTDDDGNTTYSYSKVWSESTINSSNFHDKSHVNPATKLYSSESHQSDDVRVGAFSLASNQVSMLSTNGEFVQYDTDTLTKLNLTVSGNYVTNSKNLSSPEIGDMRISFKYNNSTEVSVLAVQSGNTFTDFVSKAGKSVNRVMDGSHSGEEMINVIKKENNILKWVLRAAGLLIIVLGIGTILKPISAITSYVPILGNIVGAAVGLVSFILGLAISLVVIAVAWIRFRPVLGFTLLGIVVALIVLLIIRSKNKKATEVVNDNQNMEVPGQEAAANPETPVQDDTNTPNNNM